MQFINSDIRFKKEIKEKNYRFTDWDRSQIVSLSVESITPQICAAPCIKW